MRREILKIVFLKELKEVLRDRRSLAVMFGIPLVLYPLMTIAMARLGSAKIKEMTEKPTRAVVVNGAAAPHLMEIIKQAGSGVEIVAAEDPTAAIRASKADVVLELPDGLESNAMKGADAGEIITRIDRSRTSTQYADNKIRKLLDNYEHWIVEQRLKQRGVNPDVLSTLKRETLDVATSDQRLGNLMGMMMPLLLLITGMLGALFPALAATTTERELGTLETLLVSPARRSELLLAKGVLVLLCGLTTAGLNLLSMSLVLWRMFSMLEKDLGTLTLKPGLLILAYLGVVPSLVFFSVLALIVGMLARNFREANTFATPMMLLPMSSLIVTVMEPKPSLGLMLTPVVNCALIVKDVLTARSSVLAFVLAWTSSLFYAGLLLGVATRLFSNEQLVNPSWEPVSLRGLRQGAGGRRRRLPAADEALAIFIVSMLLLFYIQPSLMRFGAIPMLAGNEILLIAGPALLFAWVARYRWKETFSLRKTSAIELIGAAMVGVGLAIWVGLIHWLQEKFWPMDRETARAMEELLLPVLRSHPILATVMIGMLAGVCEELLYRGPIQTGLLRRTPVWFGLMLGAILFAGAHLDLQGTPLRFALGLVLGWIVWRGGSIFPAMMVHGVFDSVQIALAATVLHRPDSARYFGITPTGDLIINAASGLRLLIGAGLLVGGWLILRAKWRERDLSEPPVQMGAAGVALEPIAAK